MLRRRVLRGLITMPIKIHSIDRARCSMALGLGATVVTRYGTNIIDAELQVKCVSSYPHDD